jgi:serine/threonine protein phosphatase 1
MLLDHLRAMPHPGTFELWLMNGGSSVLAQLGIFEPAEEADAEILADLSGRLRERLGPAIVDSLRSTSLSERIGDYLFVHAGVMPDLPLDEQGPDDLLWIREPFLEARHWPHPFTVVHGHTPLGPEVLPHRIGLDSGCFFTGVLSAVEIEDRRLRFHAVSSDPDPEEFRRLLQDSGQAERFSGAWQPCGGCRPE